MVIGDGKAIDRFDLKIYGFTFKLGIPPLSPKTMLKMHQVLRDIPEIKDEGQTVYQTMFENSSSMNKVCKAIAIATCSPFAFFVAKAIAKVPMKDVETLWRVVLQNTEPDAFFFIMASVKRMNLVQKMED